MSVYYAVLAGGKSTRMGQDKAALAIGDKTLLEHAVHILFKAGQSAVIVSRNPQQQPALQSMHIKGDSECIAAFVPDELPHLGPLSGIHSLLKHVAQQPQVSHSCGKYVQPSEVLSHLVVLPVDQPLIKPESIRQLVEYGMSKKTSAHFTLSSPQSNHPTASNSGHHKAMFFPLFIYDTHSALEKVTALLRGQRRSVGLFCDSIGTQIVPIESEVELTNLNNMEDYNAAVNRH